MKRTIRHSMVFLAAAILLVMLIPFAAGESAHSHAAGLSLNKTRVIIEKKTTYKLKLSDIDPALVKWTSKDPTIAKVSKKGKITAKKRGTCIIKAKYKGKKYKCKVTVMNEAEINRIMINSYSWQADQIWNKGFCPIASYIEKGRDQFGDSMDIETVVARTKKKLKEKNTWNSQVAAIVGSKYKKYKTDWNKVYKQMLLLERCLQKGTPKAKSNYYFPYQAYDDALWVLLQDI